MEISVTSADLMRAFGEKVGRYVGSGPTRSVVIELIGDVGAGKTTFVKGLARGLGVTEDIASPSFTISRVYDIPGSDRQLHHYDFYRLSDAGILRDELGEVVTDPTAIVVIEWADIIEDVLPEDHIRLTIRATDEDSRNVIAYGLETAV